MSRYTAFSFGFLIAVLASSYGEIVPKVALKCGKPIFFKDTQDEWSESEQEFDACGSEEEITNRVFEICKALYASIETETISEATAKEFVPSFCSTNEDSTSCFGRQFICHKKSFTARSLVVPQNCTFGHSVAKDCALDSTLKSLAQYECGTRMKPAYLLHDYGVLPPKCDNEINKWKGVEFVCCPVDPATMIKENEKKLEMLEQNTATRCRLQPESGPCFASLPSWYFDAVSGACFMFNYGGCNGNRNRFDSKQECMSACAQHAIKTDTKVTNSNSDGNSQELPDEDVEEGDDGSGTIIEEDLLQKHTSSDEHPTERTTEQIMNQYIDLPYLLGGEPKSWFKVKIADIDFLDENFVKPESLNEHDVYTKALVQLEDSYESEMTGLMHDYESAERSFIQALQSTHSNAQLTDAFQKQIVQLYEEATKDLEKQYREAKAKITQKHRDRVASGKRDKMDLALKRVKALIDTADSNSAAKETALMSALTKYLDLSQDLMQHYQTHFSRVAHLSYTRAQVEHGRTLDSVYAAHEEGMGVCEKVLKMEGLSYNFQKQLDVIMSEYDDYFSKVIAEITKVTRSLEVSIDTSVSSKPPVSKFTPEGYRGNVAIVSSQDPSETKDQSKIEIEQSGVFAAKYVDKLPGVLKSENYDPNGSNVDDDGHSHGHSRQKLYLVMFACMFTGCVVATILISILRRRPRGRMVGGNTFVRVDNNPHPLSPEDKHINSLQVNGYYNPIYKFFDEPQET
ncbi:amyloid-beta precursor protein-like isoform X2 [Symsagittifera roscoffensis]|uniref:amyloid-beta precursor protein-like isoform X2 n=1 Tax=Symsagittifera roscoffensis TaxID=84072 RepID=UPI00307C43B0